MKNTILSAPRSIKKLIVALNDFLLISTSVLITYYSTNREISSFLSVEFITLFWFPSLAVLVFFTSGIYNSVLRYIDFSFIYLLIKSILIVLFVNFTFHIFLESTLHNFSLGYLQKFNAFDFFGWISISLMAAFLMISSRLYAQYIFSRNNYEKRVVIYGAGSAGIQLAEALKVSKEMQPVAFLDKDEALHNTLMGGVNILNPNKLKRLVTRNKVDEVLIAMPSASKSTLRSLFREIEEYSIKVRILPGLAELAQGKISVSELKEVDIIDLLGRSEVEPNQNLINKNIREKVVLITGAGGSIGSEISRQVVKNKAKKVILLDSNEYALYSIKNEILGLGIDIDLYTVLANVTNKERITEVCKSFQVETIYHTAAYKHVSLVEENPFEAIFNNIRGTKVCAEAAVDAEVETFVLISTDKAVRPTNVMGATKRFSELILQSKAPESSTRMIMVRFGNVIGSSGSAIPLFQQQIKDGGPVTVTHPEVIRYFMSIPEAAELVIQAGAMGKGGDVFVLDMGEPVKIYDLAKRLINLSGMEVKDKKNPDGDIEIIFTGLRPGEKLYEELLIGDNVSTTEHKQILRAEEDFLSSTKLESYFKLLEDAEKIGDVEALRDILKKVVSGFTPEEEIVDVLYLQKLKN